MIDFLLNFKNPVTLGLVATLLFTGFSLLFFRLYILPMTRKYLKLKEQIEIERLNKTAEEQKIRNKIFLDSEEKEREKVAKNIHDKLLPLIYSAKFNIERFQSKETLNNELLNESITYLTKVSNDIKEIITELEPTNVEVLSLDLCLKKTINIFKNRENLNIIVNDFSIPKGLKNKISTFICNALSELLLNIKKHAHAKIVEVNINTESERLNVIVKDDGIGFEDSLYKEGNQKIGYGLSNIIEKTNQFNGECIINSVLNEGTEIKISVPI